MLRSSARMQNLHQRDLAEHSPCPVLRDGVIRSPKILIKSPRKACFIQYRRRLAHCYFCGAPSIPPPSPVDAQDQRLFQLIGCNNILPISIILAIIIQVQKRASAQYHTLQEHRHTPWSRHQQCHQRSQSPISSRRHRI